MKLQHTVATVLTVLVYFDAMMENLSLSSIFRQNSIDQIVYSPWFEYECLRIQKVQKEALKPTGKLLLYSPSCVRSVFGQANTSKTWLKNQESTCCSSLERAAKSFWFNGVEQNRAPRYAFWLTSNTCEQILSLFGYAVIDWRNTLLHTNFDSQKIFYVD